MTATLSQLGNGMGLIADPMADFQTTALGVWVDVGARSESAAENGLSHMLEHMAFKGTKTRNARQIAEAIEDVGGQLNAYTSREQTCFYARLLKDDIPLAFDILSDILANSTFEREELERERAVICQEIGQAIDTPDDIIFDHLQQVAYPDQALGRPILGTEANLDTFDRPAIETYMDRHYKAGTMTVSIAGGFDADAVTRLAEDHFGGFAPGPGAPHDAARFVGGDYREDKALEQAHFTLGLESVPYDHPDFYAAQVMSGILGGGMSSRLFQEVREKRGLCYSIYSFHAAFRDTGMLGLYAGTSGASLAEMVPVIIGEIEKLTHDADAAELTRARAQMKAGLLMGLESAAARAEQAARQRYAYGRLKSADELIAAIDAITLDDIARCATRVMETAKPALAALGPVEGLAPYEEIAASFG